MDDEVLSKFLSGQAGDDDLARLRAEIERDPSAVQTLFEAAELERDLGDILRAEPVAVAPKRRRWRLLSVAAVALVSVAVYFALAPRPIARAERVQGRVLRSGEPLSSGDALFPGDEVETDAGARVVLRYDDGTTLDLAPKTLVGDLAAAGGKRVLLERGILIGDVRPQPAAQPLIVRSPEGEARVLGTRFTYTAGSGSSRLEVETGLVRLTRLSDGKAADVAAGQTALASAASAPVARPGVAGMAPGTWLAMPGTRMDAVTPDPARFPSTRGTSGPSAVVGAWSGGVLDTRRDRLILWGGGYSDYAGNELYAFALNSMSWQRLTDPTARPRLNEEENGDGTPNARATYNGLAYVSTADQLFSIGGARAGNGYGCKIPWGFDLDTQTWLKRLPSGSAPSGGLGGSCTYDPFTRKLWWGEAGGTYSLDLDSERWTRHNNDEFYYYSGTIDSKRGLWILVGNGKVFAIDIRGAAPVRREWKTTGAEALIAQSNPGFDYDPVRDRLVAWAGGPVYSLDPETRRWSVTEAPGAPPGTPNGIFGRWRYVPALDAFIVVTATDQDVHFYKPAR